MANELDVNVESPSVDGTSDKPAYPTEGTAITWGQSVYIFQDSPSSVAQGSTTKQSSQGSVFTQNKTVELNKQKNKTINTILPISEASTKTFNTGGSTVTSFQTPEGTDPSLISVLNPTQSPSTAGKEILVKLVANFEDNSNSELTSQSSIAIAATSNNKNATAVVNPSLLGVKVNKEKLAGVSVGSLSNLIPTVTGVAIIENSQFKNIEEIRNSLIESSKVNLSITLKSKLSEKIEFNNIKTPSSAIRFVYNFFVEEENDIESQEDPSKDPLLKNSAHDVPRYVELIWSVCDVTEPLIGTEEVQKQNAELRRSIFYDKRGSSTYKTSNVPFSTAKSKKKYTPYIFNGMNKSIQDIHSLENFAIQNKAQFNNTVSIVVNSSNDKSNVTSIPLNNQVEV